MEGVRRKLVAILAADVAGYSRLASTDEDRTIARVRALWGDLVIPSAVAHNGRVVKRMGDGILIEFRSVVDAVNCALEVQTGMAERNGGIAADRRIVLRIGVHIGDVAEEADGDLMGDGVNIAARLESIASPGSIYLSEDAYRQVRSRLGVAVEDLGQRTLKNIAEPMRVYSVSVGAEPERVRAAPHDGPARQGPRAFRTKLLLGLGGLLVLIVIAAGTVYLRGSPATLVMGFGRGDALMVGPVAIRTLKLRYEDMHDRLEPCCSKNIITTHEIEVAFHGTAIKEKASTSNNGNYLRRLDRDLTLGVQTGTFLWQLTGPTSIERTADFVDHVETMRITIIDAGACTLETAYNLKQGFLDIGGMRADTGEPARFSLPRPMNQFCGIVGEG